MRARTVHHQQFRPQRSDAVVVDFVVRQANSPRYVSGGERRSTAYVEQYKITIGQAGVHVPTVGFEAQQSLEVGDGNVAAGGGDVCYSAHVFSLAAVSLSHDWQKGRYPLRCCHMLAPPTFQANGHDRRPPARNVVAVAYDGLCGFEFGVATELFGLPRPELDVDWYHFSVVAAEPTPIRMLGGCTLTASHDLNRIAEADVVVVPGWRDVDETPPADLLDAITRAYHRGAEVMSICSGVFVLAATGLLDGRSATTHWRYTDTLTARYPRINVKPDVLFVDNGSLLTSAGSAAGIDLGLHLIARHYGVGVANRVARRLVVPAQRPGGQAQFIRHRSTATHTRTSTGTGTGHGNGDPTRHTAGSPSLAPVLHEIRTRLHESLTVADMARLARLAPRTFARRFVAEMGTTPHRWLLDQRITAAQDLLETTDYSIDAISRLAGFGSPMTFRYHFKAQTRTTPTGYRQSFSQTG